jgi:hypothetical protein
MKIKPILVIGVFIILSFNGCNDEPATQEQKPQDEMVATPFGAVPKSKVFVIEEGYTTVIEDNRVLKIESSTGRIVQDLGEASSKTKPDAGGRTQGVDPHFFSANDILAVVNSAPVNSTDRFSSFTSHIIVPVAPAQNTETIFIGNRMFIFDNVQVELVAALQYGPSAAGGGWNWGAASWKRTSSGVVTTSPVAQNLAPGSSQTIQILFSGNSYFASIGSSGSQTYTPNPAGVALSEISLFLAGSPKANASYPAQFKASLTGIVVVKNVNGTLSNPPVTWTGTTSPSNGEHFKVVNTTSHNGQVDFCFYGTPSGLNYPNNGAYPKTLTWNTTPGALSYEISYSTFAPGSGARTDYMGYSTTSPFTYPFVKGPNVPNCSYCWMLSKVRAVYPGGVVSDWSYEYNMTFGQ